MLKSRFIFFGLFFIYSYSNAGPVTGLLGVNSVAHSDMDATWTPQWANLVWYWKMNGAAGNVSTTAFPVDKGGTTCVGGAGAKYVASGKVDQAVTMVNGTTTCAGTNVTSISDNMSVGGWIKHVSGTDISYQSILYANSPQGWNIQRQLSNGKLYIRVDTSLTVNGVCILNGTPIDGSWHHIMFTLEGGVIKAYRDGGNVVTCIILQGAGFASGATNITFRGLTADGSTLLDEWGIWNSVLSPSDVATIYNKQVNALP